MRGAGHQEALILGQVCTGTLTTAPEIGRDHSNKVPKHAGTEVAEVFYLNGMSGAYHAFLKFSSFMRNNLGNHSDSQGDGGAASTPTSQQDEVDHVQGGLP